MISRMIRRAIGMVITAIPVAIVGAIANNYVSARLTALLMIFTALATCLCFKRRV